MIAALGVLLVVGPDEDVAKMLFVADVALKFRDGPAHHPIVLLSLDKILSGSHSCGRLAAG